MHSYIGKFRRADIDLQWSLLPGDYDFQHTHGLDVTSAYIHSSVLQ